MRGAQVVSDHTAQLSFQTWHVRHGEAATTQARAVLFNTQHASSARARRQAAWIGGQEHADILILTEVGAGPGGFALVDALHDAGYTSVLAPAPESGDYRTVLASRSAELRPVDSGVGFLPHRAPAATLTIRDISVGLLGLYVPSRGPRERRNEDKRRFQDAVAKALPGLPALFPNMPVIVGGDLNVIEPGHTPHHRVFGQWEYAFYEAFGHAGLTDAYRHLHPDAVDHSWFGRSGRGFRFDHVFTTTSHSAQIVECRYDHAPRDTALTDHAAMCLTLALADPSDSQRPQ